MEDGSRHKVWVLAPLLTRFLKHCLRAGALPPCISSAPVTPIHKKGCTLDAANYRPIAVGEPLYRLYTIVLNKGWWDGLRSISCAARSRQASGQDSRQSITSSPCATSSIWLASHSALCVPALWTSKRPMTLSSIIFCGTRWSPLVWAPVCWQPSSLCIPVEHSQ